MNELERVESVLDDKFFIKQDHDKLVKIGRKIVDGTITESNYYDEVRKLTRNVNSDRSMHAWQRLADYMYTVVYDK